MRVESWRKLPLLKKCVGVKYNYPCSKNVLGCNTIFKSCWINPAQNMLIWNTPTQKTCWLEWNQIIPVKKKVLGCNTMLKSCWITPAKKRVEMKYPCSKSRWHQIPPCSNYEACRKTCFVSSSCRKTCFIDEACCKTCFFSKRVRFCGMPRFCGSPPWQILMTLVRWSIHLVE